MTGSGAASGLRLTGRVRHRVCGLHRRGRLVGCRVVRSVRPGVAVTKSRRTDEAPRGCPRPHVADMLGGEGLRHYWMHGFLLRPWAMVLALHS